jgi:ubiquinone/menaquinone biosynthesis C-methylase UbiE
MNFCQNGRIGQKNGILNTLSIFFSAIIEQFIGRVSLISRYRGADLPGWDFFGLFAPWYDRVIPFTHKQRLVSMINLPVAGRLLDVGGGTGRIAQGLAGEVSMVVVADVSIGMLRQAAGKTGLHRVRSWGEQLPFPSNFFERVIMVDAFHHMAEQEEVAREMWRVLKPQGRIVIEEPDIRSWGTWLIAVSEKISLMRSHFVSPPNIAKQYHSAAAKVSISTENGTAWVIIDKAA